VGPIDILRKRGYKVEALSESYYRVNGRIEFSVPHGKWFDRKTGDRGQKPLDQIPFLVAARLKEDEVIEIESNLLVGYSYDSVRKILRIEFRKPEGKARFVGEYKNVPEDEVDAFINAKSKGSFFLKHIKPNAAYTYRRIPQEELDAETTDR